MKVQKVILKETWHVGLGTLILSAAMCGVFALLGRFRSAVALGALLGSFCAILNFFLLGLSLQSAMDRGEGAPKFMKAAYNGRMLLYAAGIAVGALAPCFDVIAVIIPLFFPQLVILGMRALGLSKDETAEKMPAAPQDSDSKEV